MFVAIAYGPWFLQSSLTPKAPSQDLKAFGVAREMSKMYPHIGEALKISFLRHTCYLTESLVVLALVDPDLPDETKATIIAELLKYDVPDEFQMGKPALPKVTETSQLADFVGENSWQLFHILGISKEEVINWVSGNLEDSLSYIMFKDFVLKLHSTNDCSERNVKLIQDFVMSSKSEEMRQNICLVAKEN